MGRWLASTMRIFTSSPLSVPPSRHSGPRPPALVVLVAAGGRPLRKKTVRLSPFTAGRISADLFASISLQYTPSNHWDWTSIERTSDVGASSLNTLAYSYKSVCICNIDILSPFFGYFSLLHYTSWACFNTIRGTILFRCELVPFPKAKI